MLENVKHSEFGYTREQHYTKVIYYYYYYIHYTNTVPTFKTVPLLKAEPQGFTIEKMV